MSILELLKDNIAIATKELEDLKLKKENVVSDNIDVLNKKLQEKAQAYVETLKAETIKELFGEKFENFDIRILDKETEIKRYNELLTKMEAQPIETTNEDSVGL